MRAASLFAGVVTAAAAADAAGRRTVAVYWGQDDGAVAEGSLKEAADDPSVQRIYMSFGLPCAQSKVFGAGGVPYVGFNFAGHVSACTVLPAYPGVSGDCSSVVADCTRCANCSMPLAQQIKYAQSKGVQVLLSIGGGAESAGKLSFSPALLASTLRDMFLVAGKGYTGPRPFGDVVLDGVDLDLEQEWGSMPAGFMAGFLKAFPADSLLTAAPQCFDFNAGYRASITSAIAASTQNGTLLHPEQACRFDSFNVQFYNNEGDLSDGSDFPKSGSDAALAKLLDNSSTDCWDDYTYGWYQNGQHHCYASKFLTTARIWATIAAQCNRWRKQQGVAGRSEFVFGTAVDQLSPDGSSGGLPWPVYAVQKDTSQAAAQIRKLLAAVSDLAPAAFGGVMLWDRGNDLTVGSKMPQNARPSALFRRALDSL
eukprot:TRINITY_DN35467_c0_g1_i1.p1 TRINITY_DN35467_c0_g1~~TRINITY_DN35467_c0_g1_i1.p1  ORF type:complete len:440 (+),score=168.81 TRINITY_DN35467_c0_g1_i1:46-1320(+)